VQKRINIALVIFICLALIFGTWKDKVYFEYIDKGLSPPQDTFCLYDRIESVLAGILCIWGGVTLIYKSVVKLIDTYDARLFLTMCFGVIWLVIGILSFWNVYASNLPNCGP
jgi:hypothetical protein